MNSHERIPIIGIAIGAVVTLTIVLGIVAWLWNDPAGNRGNRLPEEFDYDLKTYQKIDPALIQYDQKATIDLDMKEPRALTVGPEDKIYVVGDRRIRVFSSEGKRLQDIDLDAEPYCVAVGGNGARIYVGMRDHVETYDAEGKRESVWPSPGKRAVLTSIAVAEEDVFVADAGSLIVWHYDLQGKLLGRIGKRDEAQGFPGFIVPSPYFDAAFAPDGLLRVANPGLHLIEAYTFDGYRELWWGKRGMGIEAFCGCCNPAHFAIFPDGRFVTAEKGIARVKVYSPEGKFECVVAGPETLTPNPSAATETRDELRPHPVDVAVDSTNRVLVLDPTIRAIRVYEHRGK